MSGPLLFLIIVTLTIATLVFDMWLRSANRSAKPEDQTDDGMQSEVETLRRRIRDLERILTDPDEKLRRDIDRLQG